MLLNHTVLPPLPKLRPDLDLNFIPQLNQFTCFVNWRGVRIRRGTAFLQSEESLQTFGDALDFCFSLSAGALVVECGGDLFGANVPEFLTCLKARRPDLKIILVAADALGAIGAKGVLAEIGLAISLITGPCTDTPILREWTEALCGIPAINLLRSPDRGTQSHLRGSPFQNDQ